MKKAGLVVLVLAVCVLGWLQVRSSARIQVSFLKGKTATLERGEIQIPVTASGTIEPRERIEIKSEASGKVLETPVEVGDMVRAGDPLVRLDPEDEQRAVHSFGTALEQARINLERAKVKLTQSERVDLPNARARLEQTEAELKYAEFRYQRSKAFLEQGHGDEDELRQVESQYRSLQAQKKQWIADIERANRNIKLGALDVRQAELAVEKAQDDLEEAQERLKETEIRAPTDGMLSKLYASKGKVIASGSRSLHGGDLLAALSDISQLYVQAEVDEADIGAVLEIAPPGARPGRTARQDDATRAAQGTPELVGSPVRVTVDAVPHEEFSGVIELVEPEPVRSQGIGTYVVRIRLVSEPGRTASHLLNGMEANVEFVTRSARDVVKVPNEAVHVVDGQTGVYLVVPSEKRPGKLVPRFQTFRPGLDNGAYTEAVEGLEAGQEVYIRLPQDLNGRTITGDE